MKTQATKRLTPSPLDKVCIMQKYNDSDNVLECRQVFKVAENYIIKAVNNHDKLVEALKEVKDYMESLGDTETIVYQHLCKTLKESEA